MNKSTHLRFLLVIMFGLAMATSWGQADYFNVKRIKDGGPINVPDLTFPIFSSIRDNDSTSVKKINTYLQLSELHLLKGREKKSIFEDVELKTDSGEIGNGKSIMQLAIRSNTDKILSLSFEEEYEWATSEHWTAYYNFNPANGDRIFLKDLFTKDGYGKFKDTVFAMRKNALESLVKHDTNDDLHLESGEIIGSYEEDDLADYFINGTSIYIDGTNCLLKNERMLLADADMMLNIKVEQYRNWLNTFGKAVFGYSNDSLKRFHSQSACQLYKGDFGGKSKFLFAINSFYDDSSKVVIEGVCYYLNKGKGVSWESDNEEASDDMKIKEENPDGREEATLFLRIKDGIAKGKWISKDERTILKIEAKKVE